MQVKNKGIAFVTLLLPPSRLKNWLLRQMGWQVGSGCRIGFSCIGVKRVRLEDGAAIGPGMCLSQLLRSIEMDYQQVQSRYPDVKVDDLIERVVNMHPSAKS